LFSKGKKKKKKIIIIIKTIKNREDAWNRFEKAIGLLTIGMKKLMLFELERDLKCVKIA